LPTTSDLAHLKRTQEFIRSRCPRSVGSHDCSSDVCSAPGSRISAAGDHGCPEWHAYSRCAEILSRGYVAAWLPGALVGKAKTAALPTCGSHFLPEWVAIADEENEEVEEDRRRKTQERNLNVFLALLPGLLEDHEAEYALIVDGELKEVGADLEALIDYAYSEFPGIVALVQPIQQELPKSCVGGLPSRCAR